jgi:hypothetical protein
VVLRQRAHSGDELAQESARSHEDGEMAATFNRDECLAGRADRVHETPGQGRRRREVVRALDHEDGQREIAAQGSRPERTRLRHQALRTQVLPVEPVVDVAQHLVRRHEGETEHGPDEHIGALEEVRPLALDGVSPAVRVRRRAHLSKLSNRALVPERGGLRQKPLVGHGVVAGCVGHLTGPYERGEEIRPCFHHEHAEDRAPGVTDEDDLVLPQELAQRLCELDSVLGHAIDRDRLRHRSRILPQRPCGTALVPLNDREVLVPRPEHRVGPGIRGVARPTVKKKDDRVLAVLAPDRDPLLDAADLDVPGVVDAAGRRDGVVARIPIAKERHRRQQLVQLCSIRRWSRRSALGEQGCGGRTEDAHQQQPDTESSHPLVSIAGEAPPAPTV